MLRGPKQGRDGTKAGEVQQGWRGEYARKIAQAGKVRLARGVERELLPTKINPVSGVIRPEG